MFRDIRSSLARLYDRITATGHGVVLAVLAAMAIIALCKFAVICLLLYAGASVDEMRLQDSLSTGLLGGLAVWVALSVARFRREQIQEQVRTIGDLNHHLRNALSVILNSQFLPAHEQKDAILASVDRIDRALQQIVPPGWRDRQMEAKREAIRRRVPNFPANEDNRTETDT